MFWQNLANYDLYDSSYKSFWILTIKAQKGKENKPVTWTILTSLHWTVQFVIAKYSEYQFSSLYPHLSVPNSNSSKARAFNLTYWIRANAFFFPLIFSIDQLFGRIFQKENFPEPFFWLHDKIPNARIPNAISTISYTTLLYHICSLWSFRSLIRL